MNIFFSYASTFDFGYYSRLEQLQKRLWYFSYLKYPISSIYLYLTTSLQSISSSNQSSILYSNSCSGCLRCQPSLLEQYRTNQQQQQQEQKSTYFSRLYQSNRSNIKPVIPQLTPPVENPDCGVEYCMNTGSKPIQIWTKIGNDEHGFHADISENFERFNYNQETYPKQSYNVQHIRFDLNKNLIKKQLFINHDKYPSDKKEKQTDREEEEVENHSTECRIELSEKTLKFIQTTNDSLLIKKPTRYELEEDALEQRGIFLFPRRQQRLQSS